MNRNAPHPMNVNASDFNDESRIMPPTFEYTSFGIVKFDEPVNIGNMKHLPEITQGMFGTPFIEPAKINFADKNAIEIPETFTFLSKK